jgi:Rod binding domain-containing protein
MEITSPGPAPQASPRKAGPDEAAVREAAQAFEAAFLAEMLKAAGLGRSPEAFGGGAGEDQFGSFLVAEQAKAMVAAGGLGIGETVFRAMMERRDG